MTPQRFFQKLIEYSFYLVFFVTPFILTTVNFELFEFPKMLFVYAMTAIILGSWLGLSLVQGQFNIRRTWLVWPLLLFVLSQIISTLASIEPNTSVWGYYSRFHGGLVSTLCYATLFFILTSTATKRQIKNNLILLLSAATFISLYAVAEHFGIDAQYWVQDVRSRVFSTLGQPNWLAAWLGALAPLTWHFVLRPPRSFWPTALLLAQAALLVAYGLTASLFQTALPATTGGILLFFIFFGPGLYGAYWLAQRWDRPFSWLKPLALLELAGLFVLTILFTKSRSGILALGASYAFFWFLTFITQFTTGNSARGTPKKGPLDVPAIATLKRCRWVGFFGGNAEAGPVVSKFLLLTAYFLLLVLLVGTEWTPNLRQVVSNQLTANRQKQTGTANCELKTENCTLPKYFISKSTDIRKAVWEGGLNVWKRYPLFGSGVETFAYSYYNHRVRAHNDTSEWDFLYNKAHNEYLNFLATTGLFGTTAVLVLITSYFVFSLGKVIQKKPWMIGLLASPFLLLLLPSARDKLIIYPPLLVPLGVALGSAVFLTVSIRALAKAKLLALTGLQSAFLAGFVSIIITNFYGFSVVTVALVFFLFPAFSVVLNTTAGFRLWRFTKEVTAWERLNLWQWLALSVLLLLTSYFLLLTFNYWRADKTYNLGRNLTTGGNVLAGVQQLSQAISLRPQEAGYHIELAEAAATAAYAYASQDATGSAQTADQFVALADSETKTTLALNPAHLNFYKTAAKIYIVLAQIKSDQYLPLAVEALETAEKLSPTDPKITLNLGLLYNQINQTEKARAYLEKTVALKPDYRQGWIHLGQFYETQKEIDKAKAAYQYILYHIYAQDAGALEALEKLNQ